MSDYLTRAVDRETSANPGVRPALPSFFERGGPSSIVTLAEYEVALESDREVSPAEERVAADDAVLTGAPAAFEAAGTDQLTAGKSSTAIPVTTTARRETDAVSAKANPSAKQKPSRRDAPVKPAVEPIAAPIQRTPPESPEPVVRPSLGSPPPEEHHADSIPEAASAAAPVTGRIFSALIPGLRVSAAPSSVGPARNSRGDRDRSASRREVHVTIGRIEVRAIHAPPEPIPQRPAPALPKKISLEEYLKQRNGGRS